MCSRGDKDRIVSLPKKLVTHLKEQLEHARQIHNHDISPQALGGCRCRTLSLGSILTPMPNGYGSTSFPLQRDPSILALVA